MTFFFKVLKYLFTLTINKIINIGVRITKLFSYELKITKVAITNMDSVEM